MVEKTLRMNILFDFYGQLLTERQRRFFSMYYADDLSLGEIAEHFDVSRQAVYDIVKRSASALEGFESRLGLYAKHDRREGQLAQIAATGEALQARVSQMSGLSSDDQSWLHALGQQVQDLVRQIKEAEE